GCMLLAEVIKASVRAYGGDPQLRVNRPQCLSRRDERGLVHAAMRIFRRDRQNHAQAKPAGNVNDRPATETLSYLRGHAELQPLEAGLMGHEVPAHAVTPPAFIAKSLREAISV